MAPPRGSRDELRATWARFWRALTHPGSLGRNPWFYVALGIVAYTIVFGTLSFYRYWTFQTYAWDLGVYNQAYYSTVFGGHLWYYTADLPSGTGGSVFAVHVAPFLFFLVPLYAAAPGVATLLYVQAFGVGLGAAPAFAIAKWRLGSARWGLLVAGVYFLVPITQGVNWYDFHPEAFIPVTVLASIYFLLRRWPAAFLLSWVLALSVEETVAPFLIIFAAIALLATYWPRAAARSDPSPDPLHSDRRLLLLALVVAVAWLLACLEFLTLLRPSVGAFGTNYGVNWSVLGAPSALEVVPYAILHPANAWSALLYDPYTKLAYVLLLFGSLAFLPLLGEDRYFFPVLFWAVAASLSNTPAFYELGDQYTAYVLPFLVAGLVGGIARVREHRSKGAFVAWVPARWRPRRRRLPRLGRGAMMASLLVVAVVASSVVASPLLAAPADSYTEITFGVPSVTPHDTFAHEVLSYLPAHAGVLTTSPLFPEVSERDNAYVLPEGSYFQGDQTMAGVMAQYLALCPYVFLDYEVDLFGSVVLFSTGNLSDYRVLAAADGAYLYERGYLGTPELFVPLGSLSFSPGQLSLGDASLDTALPGPLGPPLYHAPGLANGSDLFTGPYIITLPPGVFDLSLDLRVYLSGTDPQLGLTMTEDPLSVHETVVNPSPAGHDYDFSFTFNSSAALDLGKDVLDGPSAAGSWIQGNLTLPFNWTTPGLFYLSGWALDPGMSMYLYGVTVEQVATLPP